ncbi:U4/U6 small nuclear ribonucleoprotein PRP4-like protein [Typha latifolia]|uniref:U4/U6 small nuclear ribonucleoprotein PRP4-like protein n=1 Tax=Typha latifolia TaxID=4733 RepID=UPI003C2CC28D
MEEDDPQSQTLTPTPTPLPIPIPPPIAAIPPPPPSAAALLLRSRGASTAGSDSDREGSIPPGADDYEISEESRLARERQEKAVQELLMKRRAYAMAVPTNDSAVRARLRRLGEPVTLFGEREMERRDRLRSLMVHLDAEGQLDRLLKAHDEDDQAAYSAAADEGGDAQIQYPFYTEGTEELLNARLEIARYSLARAKARIERAKRRRDDPDEDEEAEAEFVVKQAAEFVLDCSEIGDDRPLSGCSFSHDATLLATSSWSGITKIWSMPQVTKVATLKGHTERATDVAFSPVDKCLATASADRTAKLWSTDGSLLRSFNGHLDRLGRIAFHPSGKYLGTASFDKTWRLWDINTGTELLLQEGHSRSVYAVCFHPDGSLAASCGLDALARVWDLRSGRSILAFEGHVKPVLGISFSPSGYRLATGSEDNTCRIWDLRKRKSIYTIPAHNHLISQVKFEPEEGYFLATSSYDTKAAIWSAQDFKPIKTLAGHEAKVTSLDISRDGQHIATVAHDRTIKIWSSRGNGKEKPMDTD